MTATLTAPPDPDERHRDGGVGGVGADPVRARPGGTGGPVRVLLAEADPISRYVLSCVLGASSRVLAAGEVDLEEAAARPPRPGTVVVLCPVPGSDPGPAVHAVRSRGAAVVVLGAGWSRPSVASALAAGAEACLVKAPGAPGLVDAVVAVHSGHRVLAPELLDLLVAPTPSAGGRDPAAARRVAALTGRELQVLDLVADGATTEEIATRLRVSPATVKSHVSHALTKIGARSRLEAVLVLRAARG